MRKRFRYITLPVLVLSLVSLFTDMASEMLYPIMPVYLQSIGFSILLIGILEGLAETTAGLSKGYFGHLSDVRGKRLPFVRLGYLLSAISKPLMAVSVWPLWVFFARTTDRFGKGLRTGARDAMLSDLSESSTRARVFGFHRSLDTLGAVAGPLLALLYLQWRPADYTTLFLLAFGPGAISILLLLLLKEPIQPTNNSVRPGIFDFLKYYKTGNSSYKQLLNGLLIFALFNSSDILLLLKMKESGVSDSIVISMYIFYNLVYAVFSFPSGWLADKIGVKATFLGGLILYIVVYSGFALADSSSWFWALFLLYGLYAAATEGISKAWISLITPPAETATAIGLYTSLTSIAAFIASSLAGIIWWQAGPSWAFGTTAVAAGIAWIYLAMTKESGNIAKPVQQTNKTEP